MIERIARSGSHRLLAVALATAIVLSLSTATTNAQEPELAVSIDGFSSHDWPNAQTILTVLDADGRPVEGLSEEAIRAQISGEDVAVTSVSRGVDSNLPSFVVLAIDSSAGMSGAPLEQAKLAAHQFVDGLGPQDSIAILAYNDAANLVQPFTQDRAAAHAAIDGLVAGGGRGLYGAATQGVLLSAASVQTGRRALVLLSSGPDDTQSDPRQSLVAAQGLGVPVYALGLGPSIDRSYLQNLTAAGGGRFAETATPDGLAALYAGVSELIRNQYVVTLDAAGLDIDTSTPAALTVDVAASAGSGSAERLVCPAEVCASFRNLPDGAELKEETVIVADVLSSQSVQSVSLLVDGAAVATLEDPPYEFTVDPGEYASGDYTVSLRVTTSSENQTFADTTVKFSPVVASSSGGGSMLMPVLVVVALALIVAALAVFFLRRRKGKGDTPRPLPPSPEPQEPVSIMIAKNRARQLSQQSPEIPPPAPVEMEPVLGFLKMKEGPLAGQSFSVGAKPISIGSGHRCEIRLPAELDGQDVPSEYARVWIRGDQLMVHEIRRLTAMGAAGGQWEILSDSDSFNIGSCVFMFDLGNGPDPVVEPVLNVLRDLPATDPAVLHAGTAAPVPEPAHVPTAQAEEPLPDIFKDRTPQIAQEVDEPPVEQAAG